MTIGYLLFPNLIFPIFWELYKIFGEEKRNTPHSDSYIYWACWYLSFLFWMLFWIKDQFCWPVNSSSTNTGKRGIDISAINSIFNILTSQGTLSNKFWVDDLCSFDGTLNLWNSCEDKSWMLCFNIIWHKSFAEYKEMVGIGSTLHVLLCQF